MRAAEYEHFANQLDDDIGIERVQEAGAKDGRDGPSPLAPPVMAPEGFPALVRGIVDAACASSEAHSVAVAANVIALFCCAVGRGPFQRIGDSVAHARAFALVVGKSGKARKVLTPSEN